MPSFIANGTEAVVTTLLINKTYQQVCKKNVNLSLISVVVRHAAEYFSFFPKIDFILGFSYTCTSF